MCGSRCSADCSKPARMAATSFAIRGLIFARTSEADAPRLSRLGTISRDAVPCSHACANSRTSKSTIGSLQRSPSLVKCRSFFSPMGKFSSDFNGCNTQSTSSMMQTPSRKSSRISPHTCVSPRSSLSLYLELESSVKMTKFSTNFNIKLLTEGGVVMTTALFCFAERSLACSERLPTVARSHWKVYTRFWIAEEKVVRRTLKLIGSSAGGTHCMTRESPCASIKQMSGDTTDVLPAPMIICLTIDPPCSAASTHSSTRSTCLGRS
mmetsp:Transcript_30405/g.88909  ORF Transcript_30405/g.88909 Transcript_30405/m.88909 type:complete len:266 (-) Transcript_30405:1348-2145(-)